MSKAFVVNSFQLPNAFVDHALPLISPAATVLYIFIIRKTRGWQKEADRISLTQFQKGTSIKSRTTVVRALEELVKFGIVKKSDSPDGCVYELNDDDFSGADAQSEPDATPVNATSPENGLVQKMDQQDASPKNELVQNLDQNWSKKWTDASPKNGHTEIHYLNTVNTKAFRGESENKTANSSSYPQETIQRESPTPPATVGVITGTFKPLVPEATESALVSLSSVEKRLYKALRRIWIDIAHDHPAIAKHAANGTADDLIQQLSYLKQSDQYGFVRTMWYPLEAFDGWLVGGAA